MAQPSEPSSRMTSTSTVGVTAEIQNFSRAYELDARHQCRLSDAVPNRRQSV